MRIEILVVLVCFVSWTSCFHQDESVMDKIKAGFKLVGKFLGLDKASDLATMVSKTFAGKRMKTPQGNLNGNANIFSRFLRLLGLDTRKLSAIAVNAIIFVAQLISTSLSKPVPSQLTEGRKLKEGTPLDWMLDNPRVSAMLEDVNDSKLPENIVEYIKERGLDEETDCLQLLICKSSPLIWGMQKNLNSTTHVPGGRKALFLYLPTIDEFADYGDSCEKKHPYCLIHY